MLRSEREIETIRPAVAAEEITLPPAPAPTPEIPLLRTRPIASAQEMAQELAHYHRAEPLRKALEVHGRKQAQALARAEKKAKKSADLLAEVWDDVGRLETERNEGRISHADYAKQLNDITKQRHDPLAKVHKKAYDRLEKLKKDAQAKAHAILFQHVSGPTAHVQAENSNVPSPFIRMRSDEAASFIGNVLHAAGLPQGELKIAVKEISGRAFCDWDASVNLDPFNSVSTAVHEMGHSIEFQVPGANQAAVAFLHHRVGNEPLQQLNQVVGPHYQAWEKGRRDQFEAAFGPDYAWYVGKDEYGGKATEIISMGLELLYNDPVKFAAADPEYFRFILGILDGTFRT